MTVQAMDIVAEARDWIGTRWVHQASVKGVGVDCVGLALGVGIKLDLFAGIDLTAPEIQEVLAYGREPTTAQLIAGCEALAVPIEGAMQVGDIALFTFNGQVSHLAIVGDYPHGGHSLIHAFIGSRKVSENRFDETWTSRFASAYRYRGIEVVA